MILYKQAPLGDIDEKAGIVKVTAVYSEIKIQTMT